MTRTMLVKQHYTLPASRATLPPPSTLLRTGCDLDRPVIAGSTCCPTSKFETIPPTTPAPSLCFPYSHGSPTCGMRGMPTVCRPCMCAAPWATPTWPSTCSTLVCWTCSECPAVQHHPPPTLPRCLILPPVPVLTPQSHQRAARQPATGGLPWRAPGNGALAGWAVSAGPLRAVQRRAGPAACGMRGIQVSPSRVAVPPCLW